MVIRKLISTKYNRSGFAFNRRTRLISGNIRGVSQVGKGILNSIKIYKFIQFLIDNVTVHFYLP
jgi:hypothetical protein